MANGALIAAGAGLLGVGGFLWWKKKQEAAAGAKLSACELACIIAAKASGTTGDVGAICKGTCGAAGGLVQAGQQIANTIGGTGIKLIRLVTGQSDPNNDGNDRTGSVCSSCCPEGSKPDMTYRPNGEVYAEDGFLVTDQRGDTIRNNGGLGGVCRDVKTDAIVGYLTTGGGVGFVPWSPTPAPPPPPPTPKPSPVLTTTLNLFLSGGTREQTQGGTYVTESAPRER